MCLLGFLTVGYILLERTRPVYTRLGHTGGVYKRYIDSAVPESPRLSVYRIKADTPLYSEALALRAIRKQTREGEDAEGLGTEGVVDESKDSGAESSAEAGSNTGHTGHTGHTDHRGSVDFAMNSRSIVLSEDRVTV
jgi:hypothetical protein